MVMNIFFFFSGLFMNIFLYRGACIYSSILAQKTRLYNTIYNFSKKPNKMEDHLKIPGAEKPR
jgi:hypothetical protein